MGRRDYLFILSKGNMLLQLFILVVMKGGSHFPFLFIVLLVFFLFFFYTFSFLISIIFSFLIVMLNKIIIKKDTDVDQVGNLFYDKCNKKGCISSPRGLWVYGSSLACLLPGGVSSVIFFLISVC